MDHIHSDARRRKDEEEFKDFIRKKQEREDEELRVLAEILIDIWLGKNKKEGAKPQRPEG